jgi:hypothetical protein
MIRLTEQQIQEDLRKLLSKLEETRDQMNRHLDQADSQDEKNRWAPVVTHLEVAIVMCSHLIAPI